MHERIEINPKIHHGQPVIKGTRVPIARILAEVAAGTSFEQIQPVRRGTGNPRGGCVRKRAVNAIQGKRQ